MSQSDPIYINPDIASIERLRYLLWSERDAGRVVGLQYLHADEAAKLPQLPA